MVARWTRDEDGSNRRVGSDIGNTGRGVGRKAHRYVLSRGYHVVYSVPMNSATISPSSSSSRDSDTSIKQIDALLSGATPQFAMQLKARVHAMVSELPESHEVRAYGEKQMRMLDRLALGTTRGVRAPGKPAIGAPGWEQLPSHPQGGRQPV